MTESDDDIWALYAKGVQRLSAEKETPPPKKKKAAAPKTEPVFPTAWQEGAPLPPEPPKEETKKKEPLPKIAPEKAEPLDIRIERNLSLGDVVIEARLDLHGLTEQAAHEELIAFIETQQARGRRLTLVITGRGRAGESVLRANLPRWCEVAPLAGKIQALRQAAPHHGGDGAYYVLLRKKRP